MSCTLPLHSLSKELVLNAGDPLTLKQLLLNGADINYQSLTGWCLLFELIALGLNEEIKHFTQEGMNIHTKDTKGRSALFWAIYYNNCTITQTLIALGCDPKEYVLPMLPALHYAVYKGNIQMIKTLLSNGVDINSKDAHDIKALNYAHIYDRYEMITFLENIGATCSDAKPFT